MSHIYSSFLEELFYSSWKEFMTVVMDETKDEKPNFRWCKHKLRHYFSLFQKTTFWRMWISAWSPCRKAMWTRWTGQRGRSGAELLVWYTLLTPRWRTMNLASTPSVSSSQSNFFRIRVSNLTHNLRWCTQTWTNVVSFLHGKGGCRGP